MMEYSGKSYVYDEDDGFFIDFYDGDIEVVLKSKWWLDKSDLEIVGTQLYVRDLKMICDRQDFMTALQNVLGRPVLSDELESPELLRVEFEHKYPLQEALDA